MQDPRDWSDIGTFVASGRYMLGGSPGSAALHNNHIVYTSSDYTAGTDEPPIRTFNGSSDRELVRVPTTATPTIPRCIISMFVANDTIYLSTIDSGSSSADWAGRVFTVDPISAVLTPVGDDVFTAGHVPYAFAWHLGRVWVASNRGDTGAAESKIYWLRPGIDTTWTLDSTLSSGGVCSMHEYAGKLYVGTTEPAATFAKVLVRAPDTGVYSTSLTATGGTAVDNNAFLAMEVQNDVLYASFWNDDSGTNKISKVYAFDGASWTTSLSLASSAARPFMALGADHALVNGVNVNYLFAIGGGKDVTPLLYRFNGSTWENMTAFIDTAYELVPAFGTVVI